VEKEIFNSLVKEIKSIYEYCQSQELEFRYFFSFFIFKPGDKNEPIIDYTGAFGKKESVLKVMQELKANLEFEPGEFINV